MEPQDIRIKRLTMRSMRRGIKEMDLILTDFAARQLTAMSAGDLDRYEALLDENDHDLYQWVSGQVSPPDAFSGLIDQMIRGADGLIKHS